MGANPYPFPFNGKRWQAPEDFSRLELALLKLIDRPRYYQFKEHLNKQRALKAFCEYSRNGFQVTTHPEPRSKTFKHSGHSGDIIYSLPAVRALAGDFPAKLRLRLDAPMDGPVAQLHPVQGVLLNRAMYDGLEPLLRAQPYIGDVRPHAGEPVDFDLDQFRTAPLPWARMNISRLYFPFFGICPDLSLPWLSVPPDPDFRDCVVLARSARYRNPCLEHGALAGLRNLVFVGIESEFLEMRATLPGLRWAPVQDFLQMARIIAGCRFFIGNQSLPYALAEGLKVPRLLEVDPAIPNVVPAGGRAVEIFFQDQLTHWLQVFEQTPAE
jgi:hypothetical protein